MDKQLKRTKQCWQDMKQRCFNKNCHNYQNYGGRGIAVCERWMRFDLFLEDMGVKPDGLTLERIDNNGNYEPNNCRWADRAEQRKNQRTCRYIEFAGLRMTLTDWARHLGMNPLTLSHRVVTLKWPIDRALTYPVMTPSECGLAGRSAQLAAMSAQAGKGGAA